MKHLFLAALSLLTLCTSAHAGWTPIPGNISGAPVYATTATLNNYILKTATANCNTAYADRLKWDGGATGLVAATGRTSLALVPGTDVQAQDSELSALATVTSAANKVPYFTGSGAASVADFTSNGRDFVGKSSSANMKSSLSLNNVENTALSTWAGSTSITTVGTLGATLNVNAAIKVLSGPSSVTFKRSATTIATNTSIYAQATNDTEINSSSSYNGSGMLVAPRLSSLGTGTSTWRGIDVQPQITTSNTTSKLSVQGVSISMLRSNVSDLSQYAGNVYSGLNISLGNGGTIPTLSVTGVVAPINSNLGINRATAIQSAHLMAVTTVGSFGGVATANETYAVDYGLTVGAATGSRAYVGIAGGIRLRAPTLNATGVIGARRGLFSEDALAPNYFAGSVGIGTTTPTTLLNLKSGRPQITLTGTITGSDGNYGDFVGVNTSGSGADGAQISFRREGADTASAITIYTTPAAGSFVERMRITSAGLVGIGTTTPATALQVVGTVTAVTGNFTSGVLGKTDNSSAPAGVIGQYTAQAKTGTLTNQLTTEQWKDVTDSPIVLLAGDWDVSAQVLFQGDVAYVGTSISAGIGTVTGNDATGLVWGTTRIESAGTPTAVAVSTLTFATQRFSSSSTQTLYLKAKSVFGVGTAQVGGLITARRVY